MKVYTKTGDKGKTSLIGGTRVPKYDTRIEAYGTIDELMAHIAVVHDSINDILLKTNLISIQDRLMTCASILATDCDNCKEIPNIYDTDIEFLENEIDEMELKVPKLKSFILPGGNIASSHTHVARTICRRAERLCVKLNESINFDSNVSKYLNRLSDYLFVLSRKIIYDSNSIEIIWNPKV